MLRKIGLCCLVWTLLCAPAQAQTVTATGAWRGEAFTMEAAADAAGFDVSVQMAQSGARTVAGASLPEGGWELTLADGSALRLPSADAFSAWEETLGALMASQSFESPRYSSLFLQGHALDLSSVTVSDLLLPVLEGAPALDVDGAARQALLAARQGAPESWGTLVYYHADERQYPDTMLWQAAVNAPCLPAFYIEARTDEFGVSFTVAWTQETVSDWDETIFALEDGAQEGVLFEGFTLVSDDGVQTDTYLECRVWNGQGAYLLEVDRYADNEAPQRWTASVRLSEIEGGEIMTAQAESLP